MSLTRPLTLAPGTPLGPYEITAAIGAGGMGEVLRARDTKLGREVAIKVLPAAFAQDAERVARFRREAQILASLNHPNIAGIDGIEEAEGLLALAMELVEGEDLAERLKRGAIPVDEALPLARQIAGALEEAHEKGIVHRDLKPANVKVTADGKIKVLDFGLAKAYAADPMAASRSRFAPGTVDRRWRPARSTLRSPPIPARAFRAAGSPSRGTGCTWPSSARRRGRPSRPSSSARCSQRTPARWPARRACPAAWPSPRTGAGWPSSSTFGH